MVRAWGNIALAIAGAGVITMAGLYFAGVRGWYRDTLGRVLGGVLFAFAAICVVIVVILLGVDLPGLPYVRAGLYTVMGAAIWAGCIAFIWSQFLAPRVRRQRVPSDRKHNPSKGDTPMRSVKAPVVMTLIGGIAMVVLLGVQTATSDGTTTDKQEFIQIAIAAVNVFAVWTAANLPGYTWIKTAVAAVLAALNVLVTIILGDIGTGEIVLMAIAVLTALGVAVVPTPVTRTINGEVVTTVKGQPVPRGVQS